MVDAVVSVVVQRLGDLLTEQVVFLREVREEVEWLKNKLEWMQCFLKDAELKQGGDYRIHKWISDVRDVAYDAEDVIDDFILKEVEGTTRRVGFKASFKKFFCIYSLSKQYGTGKKIKALKNRLVELQQNQELFKITSIGRDAGEGLNRSNEILKQLRRESPYEDNEDVVGFKEDAELLMSKLLEGVPHRLVISIVGMGGLGKTTLARKLYNCRSLKDKFKYYAWVSISKEYNIQLLLQKLVKSFKIPTTKEQWKMLNDEETLEEHLRGYLDGCPYLVVIDDVWDTKAWRILRRAFPDNKNKSRVIITTRNNTVAELSDERTYVHKLSFLKDEESWELFSKKAFPSYDNMGIGNETNLCPPSLEASVRDMVSKCNGLPLAIVVLGGLLSKKDFDEWTEVQKHLWSHVKDASDCVDNLLALSFDNLPHNLRSCFLYLGLFPEDFEIKAEQLLRLWVAEGFIQPCEGALEDVAAKYLNELNDRNLIQISKRTWRRIVTFRVHDLLRELALEKSKKLNFIGSHDGSVDSALSPSVRRLASRCDFEGFASFNHSKILRLRTLLSFNSEGESAGVAEMEFAHTKLRLLRVLDVNGRNTRSLPDDMGKVIHLRYLGLRGAEMGKLPQSIGKLGALQTLDFGTPETPMWLPDEICNAKQLRHLVGFFKWPFRVNNLTNLRTLCEVYVDDRMDFDPADLINLSKLYVVVSGKGEGFTLNSIGGLRSLKTLLFGLRAGSDCFPSLQPLSQCQNLAQLKLWGWKGQLPSDMHEFLRNLKFLFVDGSQMEEDPMPKMEKLPNLIILDIKFYRRNKLVCTSEGFPRLEILKLHDCHDLKELHVDEGGMPILRGLEVTPKPLTRVPEWLKSIPAPKNCDFTDLDDWPYY